MKFNKMAGPKKRLIYYISFLILILLILRGPINSFGNGVSHIFFPFKSTVYKYTNGVKEGITNFMNYKDTIEENKVLKYKAAKLGIIERQNESLIKENSRLLNLLYMKQRSETNFRVAKISFKDSLTYHENIFVNMGKKDGIKKDMVVLAGESLIGRIFEVHDNYSVVELVSKNDIFTSVLIDKNQVLGVLKGNNSDEMSMENISVDKAVEVGERVYTSGISDVYPKGIYVGEIASASGSRNRLFKEIKVKQDFKIFDLNEVIIVSKE